MSEERMKILEMLSQGIITVSEANELLAPSMRKSRSKRREDDRRPVPEERG